jgi:hypothetical protein
MRHLLILLGFKIKENTACIYISPMAEAFAKNYTIESYSIKANNR